MNPGALSPTIAWVHERPFGERPAMSFVQGIDIISVLPFAVACIFAILVLMLEVFQRPSASRSYISLVAAVGFVCIGLSATMIGRVDGAITFGGMNYLDGYTQSFTLTFAMGGALTSLLAPRFLEEHGVDRGEFYALLLFSTAGLVMMVSAADLLIFFIALEISSIAVYGLTAFQRRSARSAEAGMKYFIISSLASCLLLYGIALIYGTTGTTNLAEIGAVLSSSWGGTGPEGLALAAENGILAAAAGVHPSTLHMIPEGTDGPVSLASIGLVMMTVAFAIKLGSAPVHAWSVDAYTGAPSPSLGFIAATVKLGGFAALVRILAISFFDETSRVGPQGWVDILYWVSILSMVLGNLMALVQTNVKRMVAYAAVAHSGYILVGVVAMGFGEGNIQLGAPLYFYAIAHTVGTVGTFGVLSYLGRKGHEVDTYEDLNGIGYKFPWLGGAMTIFIFSSAGMPPFAGFIGKFLMFRSAVEASEQASLAGVDGAGAMLTLAIVGVLASVTGIFYYLKVLVHMYMKDARRDIYELTSLPAKLAIIICVVLNLSMGLFPARTVRNGEHAMVQMMDRSDGVYISPRQLRR